MKRLNFRYHQTNAKRINLKFERKRLLLAQYIPLLCIVLMGLVELCEVVFDINLVRLGVFPFKIKGLPGIVLSPFIHSDWKHLFSNIVPFYILGTSIFYFYKESALKVFIINYLLSGICLWFGGRSAYHIGASGVVYSMATFIFISGIIRRSQQLLTLALTVALIYGNMVWGLFPIRFDISWEGHLWGALSGFMLAIVYRHEGPDRTPYDWEDEDEDDDDSIEEAYWKVDALEDAPTNSHS